MSRRAGASTPIRVGLDAHVVGRHQTGNETYAIELASALARRDDVRPIAYIDGSVAWPAPDAPTLAHYRWRSRHLRLALELPARARRDRLSLIHVQYVAPPICPVPVVVTIHDLSWIDIPGDLPSRMVWRMRATVGMAIRRAAVVLTVSEFTRQRVIDHYRLSPDRVFVTPNGVSERWRRLLDADRVARLEAAGLADLPARYILAVGARHARKNIDRLVRAVAAVRASGEDVGLVLAGPPGSGSEAVRSEVSRLGSGGWVHEVGYVPDAALVALVGGAAVVAYPSRYEGFGLPVLEALACSAVVVAADRTSIPEVAGDAALLVDPGSDDSLAAGLVRALTDEALRARLADAGPRRAALFDWDACAAATVIGYRRALES